MEWLNYHHLLYFWMVVREGSVSQASRRLNLSQPTVSVQIHALEEALGERLFDRRGRNLDLTEMGRVVFRYAEEIFSLGRELLDSVKDRPTGRPLRMAVGVADVVPKDVVHRVLQPAFCLSQPVRVTFREGKMERLLADLAAHLLDVVVADAPVGPSATVRAFSHLLLESDVTFLGTAVLASKARAGFPASLANVPLLLPTENTSLRRSVDQWFESLGIRPAIAAEFEDSALMKVYGQEGLGVFPVPTAVEASVRAAHGLRRVGTVASLRERFYAISMDRHLKHPAVVAVCHAAQAFAATIAQGRPSRKRRTTSA